jgi:exonuclease VII large subunit
LYSTTRASVPTHAGKMLGDPWERAEGTIDTIERSVFSLFRNQCTALKNQLKQYQSHFVSSFARRLGQRSKEIDDYQVSMMRCFKDMLRQVRRIEDNFNQNYERFVLQLKGKKQAPYLSEQTLYKEARRFYVKLGARLRFSEEQYAQSNSRFDRHLNYLSEELSRRQRQIIGESKRWYLSLLKKITEAEKVLLASDPQLKLKQGFSIVKDLSGKVIKSSKAVKIHDIIAVQLFEGRLDTEVEKIE